jgi:hypothetical protein
LTSPGAARREHEDTMAEAQDTTLGSTSDRARDDADLELVGLTAAELPGLSLADLRAQRDEAIEAETGLSYLRRLVQGPLDLVRRELERRAAGGHGDVAQLVEDLPDVLAESGRSGGGRLPRTLEPTEIDAELAGELDRLTAGGTVVADLPARSDDELVALAADLDALERTVSSRRRRLHRTIDALNGELAGRYRSGDATVEGTLSSPS